MNKNLNLAGQVMVALSGNEPKAVQVDTEGKLQVGTHISVESVTATDVTIKDPTTPANKLKIDSDGSIKTFSGKLGTLETVINAQSVAAGGNISNIPTSLTGKEKELWIFLNVDQQPWSFLGSYATVQSGFDASALYPTNNNTSTTYPNSFIPAQMLYTQFRESTGVPKPTNVREAKDLILYNHSGFLRFENRSSNVATVTIKLLRIWR